MGNTTPNTVVETGSCQRNEGDTREVGEAGAASRTILWKILHLYLIGEEKVLRLCKGGILKSIV